ncbi:hypothetical protein HMPREF1868_01495 [Olsenella sp. DNF00959]|nr:hypothetical protein HMPREF1868_01495 [Olsenella sp. DNF00959]
MWNMRCPLLCRLRPRGPQDGGGPSWLLPLGRRRGRAPAPDGRRPRPGAIGALARLECKDTGEGQTMGARGEGLP